jgi:hypothetical protein
MLFARFLLRIPLYGRREEDVKINKSTLWVMVCLVAILACGGGGGGSNNSSGNDSGSNDGGGGGNNNGGGGGTTPPATNDMVVLASNDLGMHCIDREFSVFSILPPFNVINAQVIGHDTSGNPLLLDDSAVQVRYDAVADAAGSINSTSIAKTDFWTYADQLFGTSLSDGQGLTGRYMPQDAPSAGAQPFDYNATRGWFYADGIPITPLDDAMASNPYSLMKISANDVSTGQQIGSLNVVVPVASETDCQSCHKTGGIAALGAGWASDADKEVESKINILRLHDQNQGTALEAAQPVLCAQCHYSFALDLGGSGPSGDQVGKASFSNAMHDYHGQLQSGGQPIFANDISACYQCHPGKITQCLRGAMSTGGMDCIDCHGGMLAVGAHYNLAAGGSIDGANDGGKRRPWRDLPRCQGCHTGDAVDHLTGPNLVASGWAFRLRQAYQTGDNAASPLLATNKRFAEQTNTLYRYSKGHGGVFCEGCHGSTHAVWPNATASANDNVAAQTLQGHTGKIIECSVCHVQGTLPLTTDGPHGLHNIADSRWYSEDGHGHRYGSNKNACKACHGTDLAGTPLSKTSAARSFRAEGRTVTFAAGDLVGCTHCHERPGL